MILCDLGAVLEQRISVVTLGVTDMKRSISFYESMCWEKSAGDGEAVAFFQMPGLVFGLYGMADLAEDAGQARNETPGFGGMAVAHNVASKAEVDRILAKAVTCGAVITRAAEDQFWGGYSGYFADPDGHAWEIAWNPHWQITADGQTRMGTD
ncbi:MAG: VOC family protein [Alphaproteobacteria bacterium]